MGIEIPESLQWVAKYVVGAGDWPEGDETAMRRVETAWVTLADTLQDIGPDANHAIDQVLAAIEGDTAKAISDRWTELGHGQGAFDGLIEHIKTLGDEIGDGAADIEHTKLVILATLAIFAVEMAVMLATAATGIGAPAAAAEAAVAQTATRIAIRTALKQLLQRLLSKAALKAAARAAVRGAWAAALEETVMDLGVKAVQVAAGRRDEITVEDLTEAGKNAVTAAATGAVTGALGPDGLPTRNVPGGPEGGNRLADAAADGAKETLATVAGEVAGEATDAALNDREFSLEQALSPENLTSAAAAGVQRGTETLGENNSSDTGDTGNSNDGNESEGDNPSSGDDPDTQSQEQNRPERGDQSQSQNQPQGQNQSQGQQPGQPHSPDGQSTPSEGPSQTRPASSGEQPTGQQSQNQSADTGQQPSRNDSPAAPPADTPDQSSSSNESPATPEIQQSSEPGQSQPSDSGAPETPQLHPTDSPPAPQHSADTATPQTSDTGDPEPPYLATTPHTGDTAANPPQSAAPAQETQPGTQTPTSPTRDPAAPQSQQPTSSLNLPPHQPTSSPALDTATPGPDTPENSTDLGPAENTNSGGSAPQSATTTTQPTTGSPAPATTPPAHSDTAAESNSATVPGASTPVGIPEASAPATGALLSSPTTPETSVTTSSAATTGSTTLTPPGSLPSPVASGEPHRSVASPDGTTGTPISTASSGSSRNQPRVNATQRPGESAQANVTRQSNSDNATSQSGPVTPGYDYNIFDPANHARFLADFSRPPVFGRDPSTPDRGPTTESGSRHPDQADSPTPDTTSDNRADTTAVRHPSDGNNSAPTRHNPNSARPGDPVWGSPPDQPVNHTEANRTPPNTTDPASALNRNPDDPNASTADDSHLSRLSEAGRPARVDAGPANNAAAHPTATGPTPGRSNEVHSIGPSPTNPSTPSRTGPVDNVSGQPVAPTSTPGRATVPDEGQATRDGFRRFNSDQAGERYGENRLSHVYRHLPPVLRNAVFQYTRQSFPNSHLRGHTDMGQFFDNLRRDSALHRELAGLNGGVPPTTRHEMEAIWYNPNLSLDQRNLLHNLLVDPSMEWRLWTIGRNHQQLQFLRQYFCSEPTQAVFNQRIAEIDAAVNQPLPEPVEVLRGLHDISFMTAADGQPLGNRDPRMLIGAEQHDPGYMSTALGATLPVIDNNPYRIRINMEVPAGSRGLWMGQSSDYPNQRELILPRNSRFQIVNARHTGWTNSGEPVYELQARLIPPEASITGSSF